MHQLWQHPNGNYYVLYGPRLKRRLSARTKDRGRAETFLAQFIAGSAAPVVDSPSVGEILTAYEQDRKPHVRSPETLSHGVRWLSRQLGSLQPHQLLPSITRRYAVERGRAAGTILREIGTLRAALAWAVEHQWIATALHISNPVKTPRPRQRWMPREEAGALLGSAHEIHLKTFMMLGFMTTARSGAIIELQWPKVDFHTGLIDYGEGHGNKHRAVVPMNDELRATLVMAKQLACTSYVIERHGKRVKHISKGFRAACKRAGIKGVSPHIMRHSAITWMVMDGIEWREISRLTGDDEETLKRVYGHHSPSYLRRATKSLQLETAT